MSPVSVTSCNRWPGLSVKREGEDMGGARARRCSVNKVREEEGRGEKEKGGRGERGKGREEVPGTSAARSTWVGMGRGGSRRVFGGVGMFASNLCDRK